MKLAKTLLVAMAMMLTHDISTGSGGVAAQRQRRRRRDDERDITAEEVDQITDDASIQDNLDDEINKEMMQEWDEHMSDFMPDDMLQVQLDPKTEIVSTIFRSFLTLTFV